MVEHDGKDVAHQAVVAEPHRAQQPPPHVAQRHGQQERRRPPPEPPARTERGFEGVAPPEQQVEGGHQRQQRRAAVERDEEGVENTFLSVHSCLGFSSKISRKGSKNPPLITHARLRPRKVLPILRQVLSILRVATRKLSILRVPIVNFKSPSAAPRAVRRANNPPMEWAKTKPPRLSLRMSRRRIYGWVVFFSKPRRKVKAMWL